MNNVNLNNDTTECIVKTQHLTNETVHNICTNQTYIRSYGLGDYGLMALLITLGVLIAGLLVILFKIFKEDF
jgi:hypothetical protein